MKKSISILLACGALAAALPAHAANEANYCTFTGAGLSIHLNGACAYNGAALRVVPNANGQTGSCFLASSFAVSGSTPFHTHFRIKPGAGGQGMTFVVQGAGNTAIGSGGNNLGYGGITPSIAVEFDTHRDNVNADPDGNHVAILTNGSVNDTVVATPSFTLGGATVDVWVDYDATSNGLAVFVANTTTKPSTALVQTTFDLATLGSAGYAGFTAATGSGANADEDVVFWSFTTGNTLVDCTSCSVSTQCNVTFPSCDTTRGQCGFCTVDPTACAGTTPACDATSGACSTCSGDNGAVTPKPCPRPTLPACQLPAGTACTQCSSTNASQCANPTPACNASGSCATCNGDQGQGVTQPCPAITNPACQGDGRCTQCSAQRLDQCTGPTGACNTSTGGCVACTGDLGQQTTFPCADTTKPACQLSGACTQCTSTNLSLCDPTSTSPSCNLAGSCAGCNGDNGQSVSRPCPVGTAPACQPSGACRVCNPANLSLCSGATPTCNATTGACTACDGDNGSGSAQSCPSSANPYCVISGTGAGTCSKCTSSADCVGHPLGAVCDLLTGACGTSCNLDTECTASQWCASSVCTTKTPNGQQVPALAGTCSPAIGARACLSGVCEENDDTCGLKNGSACGPAAGDAGAAVDAGDAGPNGGSQCRSGVCFSDGKCGKPLGETCAVAADCRVGSCENNVCVECTKDSECGGATSGRICDATSLRCVDGCRATGGNGCPAGSTCTSTSNTAGSCLGPPDAGSSEGGVGDGAPPVDATPGGDAAPVEAGPFDDIGELGGSGLFCDASPSGGASGDGPVALLALGGLAVALGARRRRQRARRARVTAGR